MRELFINNGPLIVWLLAAVELVCGVIAVRQAKKLTALLSALVSFGLAIDASIIGLGNVIGEGALLQGLSQVRYVLHGILVPLMIPIAFFGFGIKKKWSSMTVGVITGIVIALGIAMGFMIKTEPATVAGILRYATADATSAFASTMERLLSFGGVIPLIIMGLLHLILHKRPFLFLSGLLMFVFSALAPATGNMDIIFLVTMVGEALMVIFFDLEFCIDKK